MPQPHATPTPPSEPAWDIAFTRLTRAVQPRVEACRLDLARRFQAIGLGPCASLDIRLLDACGDVVAGGLASGVLGHASGETCEASAAETLSAESLDRAATTVYVAALAQFDLLRPSAPLGHCA